MLNGCVNRLELKLKGYEIVFSKVGTSFVGPCFGRNKQDWFLKWYLKWTNCGAHSQED